MASEIQASAVVSNDRSPSQEWTAAEASAPRFNATPVPAPFVLPGESLSKYGGTAADSAADEAAEAPAPARPASSYKPSTLIDSPIEWDGSGLLPGESISRHRTPVAEPAVEVDAEPHGIFSDAGESSSRAPDTIEEQDFFEEVTERAPESVPEPVAEAAPEEKVPAETDEALCVERVFEQPSADDPVAAPMTRQDTSQDEPVAEAEPDADATHNLEPAPPSGFRLFGLGHKKKKAEEEAAKAEAKPVRYPPSQPMPLVAA